MKIAIVTGASRGIGAGVAEILLEQGWRVIGLARSAPAAGIEHQACDFSKPTAVEQLAKTLPVPDLIVCAAGMGKFASAEGFSVQQIEELMRVNFTSHAVLIGTLLPGMKKSKSGKIIVIGSEAALQGARLGSIYCASKFALRGYCQSLRAECRPAGIAVSLVNPGLVRTNFHDELHFEPSSGEMQALHVLDVCGCVSLMLELPIHAVVEEVNIQPIQSQVVKKSL
jgi:3-hydroxy acid dehydrogenase / malonic semialdehyde reductase